MEEQASGGARARGPVNAERKPWFTPRLTEASVEVVTRADNAVDGAYDNAVDYSS